jgi:hypothetical protein
MGALAVAIVFSALVHDAQARTKDQANTKKNGQEQIQRDPTGVFDLQKSVVSNFDFYTTNYGIFGYDVRNGVGGGVWPRGSRNQYMFAGGIWFAAQIVPPEEDSLRKRVLIGYNPNNGRSWMVPGPIGNSDGFQNDQESILNFRTYFSTDFNTSNGVAFLDPDYPNWPIWDTKESDTVRFNNYYGDYVSDPSSRNRTVYPKGPAFISGEDIYAVYRDTDLNRYDDGAAKRRAEGFPFGMEIEQMIYSWGFGDYRDFIFIKYLFIHPDKYPDTLFACWMGAVMDVDIALTTNSQGGARNDRARFYDEDTTLNLALVWSNGDQGEAGQGFGYLGFNFLESPAVDADGYLRKDAKTFPVSEQLGMRTFRNWPIDVDPQQNEERYNFMSTGQRDNDVTPGDRRIMFSTGPFNMRPNDSCRIVVGVILAGTAKGLEADGTTEDMAELVRKTRFAQSVYDNNFRAPQAPDRTVIRSNGGGRWNLPAEGWVGLNNAMVVQWDETSELSIDTLSRGLDFMGYRIYRARRTDLDTFDVDNIDSKRRGPLGWKQVARYAIPSPWAKSNRQTEVTDQFIDRFDLANPVDTSDRKWLVVRTPNLVTPWLQYFDSVLSFRPDNYRLQTDLNGDLVISRFDHFDSVRFTYLTAQFSTLPSVRRVAGSPHQFGLDTAQVRVALDSLYTLILKREVKEEPFLFPDTNHVYDASGNLTIVSKKRPWEESNEVRREVFTPYFMGFFNDRSFFDEGDDNNDGRVDADADPTRREVLTNSIDYYYKILSYDEGDYFLPIGSLLNDGQVGLPNVVTANPAAGRPTTEIPSSLPFRVDAKDSAKIGGVYNLRLLVNDKQRLSQLFGNTTLELAMFRVWQPGLHPDTSKRQDSVIGLYAMGMFLRDSATKALVGQWFNVLPPELCGSGGPSPGVLPGYFTENALTWTGSDSTIIYTIDTDPPTYDTVSFGVWSSMEKELRYGSFTSAASCFPEKYAYGTVGLAFDYGITQFGGMYRGLPQGEVVQGTTGPIVGASSLFPARMDQSEYYANDQIPNLREWFNLIPAAQYGSSNNGPGVYEIEFLEGGTEDITTVFNLDRSETKDSVMTFRSVPYLNVRVRNVLSYDIDEVSNGASQGTRTVTYPNEYDNHIEPLDSIPATGFPNPRSVPVGSFNISAFGWRNTVGSANGTIARGRQAANKNNGTPLGQGRYYLSRNLATTGQDTLDFCHALVIDGVTYVIDWSHKAGRTATLRLLPGATTDSLLANNPEAQKADFKAGDKIRVSSWGGAAGFPWDTAYAYVRIQEFDPTLAGGGASYTNDMMDQIRVVPNPYYVTHEGQASPFEGKLYFTRLPRQCTIDIYTTAGALVKSVEHNEASTDDSDGETSSSSYALNIWDLLSQNRQRVASQMLIARITTPDGAETIKKFTVVVGPARVINE